MLIIVDEYDMSAREDPSWNKYGKNFLSSYVPEDEVDDCVDEVEDYDTIYAEFAVDETDGHRNMGRLSEAQREAAEESNDLAVDYALTQGDAAEEDGDELKEALWHRYVQENVGREFYDPESEYAWKWNCETIHNPHTATPGDTELTLHMQFNPED